MTRAEQLQPELLTLAVEIAKGEVEVTARDEQLAAAKPHVDGLKARHLQLLSDLESGPAVATAPASSASDKARRFRTGTGLEKILRALDASDGLTPDEVAAATGMTKGAVTVGLRDARRHLDGALVAGPDGGDRWTITQLGRDNLARSTRPSPSTSAGSAWSSRLPQKAMTSPTTCPI